MTREEALKRLGAIVDQHGLYIARQSVEASLDGYVALGMIKLDEPKDRPSPTYRAFEAVFEYVPSLDYADFQKLIDGAGLKIVEKQP
jgi:hypothetical protein